MAEKGHSSPMQGDLWAVLNTHLLNLMGQTLHIAHQELPRKWGSGISSLSALGCL
jgi:hypothetical protein